MAVLKTVADFEPGTGRVTGGVDCLFEPDFARRDCSLAEKRLVHLEFVLRRPTPHNRLVGFGQLLFFDQRMKISGGIPVRSHEYEPAGLAVEPSDNGHLTPVGDFKGEQLSELMPQRHGSVRLSRMDEQMSGFIEDQEARVLEENAAAERFGGWWLACHEQALSASNGSWVRYEK